MIKKALLFVLLALTFFVNIKTVAVFAQEKTPVTDDQVNEVARQLYCPVCENISLDVCPTQACEQWRSLIREKLEAGWTTEQIKDYFAAQYGDRVLPEPPKKGINWLVYILPPAMIFAGAILLARIITRLRAQKEDIASVSQVADTTGDEYLSRVEEELKKRKG